MNTTTYHLTPKSANVKTGPIPVSTTSATTCPPTCGVREACYAASGPLALHWRAVTAGERGTDLEGFAAAIKALPEGALWRHNQAGDLPGDGVTIDVDALAVLLQANKGRKGFTYTHYPMTPENARMVAWANREGFAVNLSADNMAQADQLAALSVAPVVVVVPMDAPRKMTTPEGRPVVTCPATYRDGVSCATCALCQKNGPTRAIVAFPAHGTQKRMADAVSRKMIPIAVA